MAQKSLEDALKNVRNPVEMLRNSQIGAYVYPVVPAEFTNWRDEQAAWRKTCVLFDQSHHMVDLYIEGPDALKLLSNLAINSFANFPVNRAKQFVPCSYSGHVIGDGILFHLEQNKLVFVGRAPSANWIQFHAETGGYDVKIANDDRSPGNPKGKAVNRISYRFQIQGPNAGKVIKKLNGGPVARHQVLQHGRHQDRRPQRARTAPRHGRRAGARDLGSLRGARRNPRDHRRGRQGVRASPGRRARLCHEHARVGLDSLAVAGRLHRRADEALPRVAAGDELRSHGRPRRQLRLEQHRGLLRHAVRDRLRPVREVRSRVHRPRGAREDRRQAASPEGDVRVERRRRHQDRSRRCSRAEAEHYKYIDLPLSNYASASFDKITRRGKVVGASMFAGYSYNERSMLSLGIVDPDVKIGAEVTLVWGEEGGGTKKITVEPHKQIEIRAIVSPVPVLERRTRDLRRRLAHGQDNNKASGSPHATRSMAECRAGTRFALPQSRSDRSRRAGPARIVGVCVHDS